MPNSIYDQLGAALGQSSRYGKRTVFYRGLEIECAVLLGNTSTRLVHGGLQEQAVVHVLISRALVPTGQDGDPHTNETVLFPARPSGGLIPRELMIHEVIAQEWDYAITLIDPTQ